MPTYMLEGTVARLKGGKPSPPPPPPPPPEIFWSEAANIGVPKVSEEGGLAGGGAACPSETEVEAGSEENIGVDVGVGVVANRGSGVRRRISPRAGLRSPRRAVGWTALSPRRQDAAGGSKRGNNNAGETRPTALVFPDDSPRVYRDSSLNSPRKGIRDTNPRANSPRVHRENSSPRGNSPRRDENLKIDVRAVEEEMRGGLGEASNDRSARRVFAEAETPLAGAGRAAAAKAATGTAAAAVAASDGAKTNAAASTAIVQGDEVANIATEVVVRQIGLKCSIPIYDRGKNLLGNVEGSHDGDGQRKATAPSRDDSGGAVGEA